jgi:hypothetical protein
VSRLSYLPRVLNATARNILLPRRLDKIGEIAKRWIFMAEASLPVLPIQQVFPSFGQLLVDLPNDPRHVFELPYLERAILHGIVRTLQPAVIFEFGTFLGSTTVLLARAADPECIVHTIDLPRNSNTRDDLIGRILHGETNLPCPVVEHRCDLGTFDPEPWLNQAGVVFVDASHEPHDVIRDSRTALRLLRPGGTIIWDDYQPAQPGVVRALNRLSTELPIIAIEDTRLALYTSPAAG